MLVEVASDEHECNSVSNLTETDSTSTSQRVGEEVPEEVTAAERNRFHDERTITSGVGNENRFISLGTCMPLTKQIEWP